MIGSTSYELGLISNQKYVTIQNEETTSMNEGRSRKYNFLEK